MLVKNTTCRDFLTGKGCVLWGTKPDSGTHPSFDEPRFALSSSLFPSQEGMCLGNSPIYSQKNLVKPRI